MSHAQSLWSAFPSFFLFRSTIPSLSYPSHSAETTSRSTDRRTVWSIGRKSVSPTPLSRLTVQRLHLFAYHQGEQVSVQCAILVRMCLRKSVRDESMGMLASPLFTLKREASAAPARIDHSNRVSCLSRSSRIPSAGRTVAMYSHQRTSSREPKGLQESYYSERGYSPIIEKFGLL